MRILSTIVLPLLLLSACTKPTAKEAADKLVAAGVLANCTQEPPRGLNARASEYWKCELPSVPGEGAGVMTFADDDAYQTTIKAFDGAAVLAGPHRYGNARARVFVQMNQGASLEVGNKAKAIVDSL
ncbi:hypothetical protein [Polyangium jinanense]|uniref:Lipoprotein n=1 Tax=Polyangium jinanense TaxID=2829994 RepID=A0A9X4AWZ3_9BACT|nr:hypothetical protein [Polyangium jinanense]MDC3985790.1 hypothetical protein [Polyangium jinanense]